MVVSGVALVCASLTRPNGSLVLLLVVAGAVIIARAKIFSWRQATTSVLVIMLLTFGLIALWTLRNYRISHRFIPVSTDSGTILTGAYNDTALFSATDRGLWVGPARVEPLEARNISYLSILLTIIQCLVFYGSSRLRAPIEPMLVLLAAGAIWWLTQNELGTLRWKRTRLIKKSGDEQLATS